MLTKYTVVFETGPASVGAYIPDIPGCVAVGDTVAVARELIAEAMEAHLAAMVEDGDPIPAVTSIAEQVEVSIIETSSV